MSALKSFFSTLFHAKPTSDCCSVTFVENDETLTEEVVDETK